MSSPLPSEYLAPEFDASTLKVAQLRGLLLEHNVKHLPTAKKAELVQAFDEHVRSKSSNLLSAASRVKPSGRGIITVSDDGTETMSETSNGGVKRGRGRPRKIVGPDEAAQEPQAKKPRSTHSKDRTVEVEIAVAPPTRARRRPRQTKKSDDEDVGAEAEMEAEAQAPLQVGHSDATGSSPSSGPSGRRRAKLSSASTTTEQAQSTKQRTPAKRKSESALNQLREESEKEDEPSKSEKKRPKTPRSEDSGFSDFNPFQSGGEDAREREKRRRKSSIGPSRAKAQPRPSEPAPPTLHRVGPSRESLKTPPKEVRDALRSEAANEHNQMIQAKLNQISYGDIDHEPHITVTSHVQAAVPLVKRTPSISSPRSIIPLSTLFLLLLAFIANYKNKSASIGHCDSGSVTNDIILSRQNQFDNANACILRRTELDLAEPGAGKTVECDVSALPLVPFMPRPFACAPCPLHAVCEDGLFIACEPEYLLTPHTLAFVSPALDGLPGIGPKAFPPTCRPDTAKKRMIGGLAKEMERDLARGRGLMECAGIGKEDGRKGLGERFGVEETALHSQYASRRDPKFSLEQFTDIFEAAMKDLVEHEDVIESIDVEGRSWYAAARTEMSVACRAKLEASDLLSKWKSQLGTTAAVLALIQYLRSTMKRRTQEKFKAEELVQVVLKRLQDQERLHYSDPATTVNPFVAPAQLRDVVLPLSGSTASKSRLWQRVQDLIETNANVSVREREVRGEVWKTWEWTGVGERRVTFE